MIQVAVVVYAISRSFSASVLGRIPLIPPAVMQFAWFARCIFAIQSRKSRTVTGNAITHYIWFDDVQAAAQNCVRQYCNSMLVQNVQRFVCAATHATAGCVDHVLIRNKTIQ